MSNSTELQDRPEPWWNRPLQQVPMLGTIDRELRTRDDLGALAFLGAANLGAGLGTLTAGGEVGLGFFWLLLGMGLCSYTIVLGPRRSESADNSESES